MLCKRCGKPASEYVVRKGGTEKLPLCSACYEELMQEEGESLRCCEACGTSWEEFRRTGLLGCAECYRVFRKELLLALRGVQGGTRHEGKEPVIAAREDYSVIFEQEELKSELERALREGRYGEVARLSEQLKTLKKKSKVEETP